MGRGTKSLMSLPTSTPGPGAYELLLKSD